jgi:hypothetical protein
MTVPPQSAAPCVHRWLLSPPLDGKVEGECRSCGKQRAFSSEPSRYRAYGRGPTRTTKSAS